MHALLPLARALFCLYDVFTIIRLPIAARACMPAAAFNPRTSLSGTRFEARARET